MARQTVRSWTRGSKIGNKGICKIIDTGGYEAFAYFLGTKSFLAVFQRFRFVNVFECHDQYPPIKGSLGETDAQIDIY